MTTPLLYDRFGPADAATHDDLLRQAFASPADRTAAYREIFGTEAIRLVRAGTETAAALTLIPMGQWYGGRPVPCAGIGGLTVAPPFKGRGISTFMLTELFAEAKARGLPLCTLYPSTVPVYRKAGFEVAGHWIVYAAGPTGWSPESRRRPPSGA